MAGNEHESLELLHEFEIAMGRRNPSAETDMRGQKSPLRPHQRDGKSPPEMSSVLQ